MNTDYLIETKLNDKNYVAALFDHLHCDAIEVRGSSGIRKGLIYLDDFCNMQKPKIELSGNDDSTERNAEENKLLLRVQALSDSEIEYVRNRVLHKFGKRFVCCCDDMITAETIMSRIFNSVTVNIRYTESIFDLYDGENALFLSFNRIKLYRKAFRGRISSLIALNNLVLDCENRTFFYDKYKDLMDALSSIGVVCLYGIIPEADQLSCLSEAARQRVAGYGKADYDFCAGILGGYDSQDFIACLDQVRQSRVIDKGIYKSLQDCTGRFYNVAGGMRITIGQPDKYDHTVYLFGPCTTRGAMVSDEHTVGSFLQKKLNETGDKWLVFNCGVGGGSDLENSYRYALSLPLKSGDAVLFLESGSFIDEEAIDGTVIFKLSDYLNVRPPPGEWFLDRPAHCNAETNKIIADDFFNRLFEYKNSKRYVSDSQVLKRFRNGQKIFSGSHELSQYLTSIANHRFMLRQGECAGAILMHCNPMTRGHKYLIESALEEVDYLYVFLLSIDRSEIPYALRKEMLIHETREFSNVQVLDCGEFQGSPKVFPAYFTKDSTMHTRIDATKEVLVFCQHVAPILGITKRFVGTEDRDFVTRQYNNQLKLILPMYDIELREIKRMAENEKDVSAFLTRQFIHEGRWADVARQVSPNSFRLLYRYYTGKEANA